MARDEGLNEVDEHFTFASPGHKDSPPVAAEDSRPAAREVNGDEPLGKPPVQAGR
jgi:hypothetical protein